MESKANTKQKDNMQENNRFNNDKIYKNIKLPLKSLALFIFIMSFAIDKLIQVVPIMLMMHRHK